MEDFSYIVAIALGLAAILSPIATALINNDYLAKQKQIELYDLAKRKSLSDYIEASLTLANNKTLENETQFYIALNKLYIYFSDLSKFDYDKLSDINYKAEYQSDYSHELVEQLAKQIKKL